MIIPRDQIQTLCQQYGPLIRNLPAGVDGAKLLWALAGNESSFGENTKPKHEREYCAWHLDGRRGKYSADPAQAALFKEYGCLACCSYGAWQVMMVEAKGFAPAELISNPVSMVEACVSFLSRHCEMQKPADLEAIGQIYNGGHVGAIVPAYVTSLKAYYATCPF